MFIRFGLLKCRWGLRAVFPPKSFWCWFGANLKPSSCILSTYSKLALELQHLLPGLWQRNTVQWDAQGRDYQNKSPTLCVVTTFVLWHKKQKKMISCFCQTNDFWYSCLALASLHSPICHSSAPKSSSIWTGSRVSFTPSVAPRRDSLRCCENISLLSG